LSVTTTFEKLRAALEAAKIPYFVSGSFASSAHGLPRSTNDIDIVIAPPAPDALTKLLQQFPASEFGLSEEDARDAFKHRGQFNVVDYASHWKVDFILRQDTAFDTSRFARRTIVEIAGVHVYAASAEDILVTKLWWAKLSESERQIADAAGIIRMQGDMLQKEYVERWVSALDLADQWLAARKKAG
jgi:hypothetical protein